MPISFLGHVVPVKPVRRKSLPRLWTVLIKLMVSLVITAIFVAILLTEVSKMLSRLMRLPTTVWMRFVRFVISRPMLQVVRLTRSILSTRFTCFRQVPSMLFWRLWKNQLKMWSLSWRPLNYIRFQQPSSLVFNVLSLNRSSRELLKNIWLQFWKKKD